jgi:hypothetical protein
MRSPTDLRTPLIIIAFVEAVYAASAPLTPPSLMPPITGWVLSPDGHWPGIRLRRQRSTGHLDRTGRSGRVLDREGAVHGGL